MDLCGSPDRRRAGGASRNAVAVHDLIVDTAMKAMSLGHRAILRLSGGRVLSEVFGMPAVVLETTGRKSGFARQTTLTAPVVEADRIVLVASKGGDHRQPDWYLNVVATPEIKVTVKGRTRLMRARVASAEEKAELWPRVISAYNGYAGYQRRTQRDIPLVICEPLSDARQGFG